MYTFGNFPQYKLSIKKSGRYFSDRFFAQVFHSVCVRDCALAMAALVTKVAFQIAKCVAFFTIENKHGHDQTAAKCNTEYIKRRW